MVIFRERGDLTLPLQQEVAGRRKYRPRELVPVKRYFNICPSSAAAAVFSASRLPLCAETHLLSCEFHFPRDSGRQRHTSLKDSRSRVGCLVIRTALSPRVKAIYPLKWRGTRSSRQGGKALCLTRPVWTLRITKEKGGHLRLPDA